MNKTSIKIYHGILVNHAFKDPSIVNEFISFNRKKDEDWQIVGIELSEDSIKETIIKLQGKMVDRPCFYIHFYNKNNLIIVFKNKIFYVKTDKLTWDEAINYGKKQGIPIEQLDFLPNKTEEEEEYFK